MRLNDYINRLVDIREKCGDIVVESPPFNEQPQFRLNLTTNTLEIG